MSKTTENGAETGSSADQTANPSPEDNTSEIHLAADSQQVKKYTQDISNNAILAPVDFSQPSKAALIKAARFAGMMNAPLVILHVVHDPSEMPGYYAKLVEHSHMAQIHEIASDLFNEFIQQLLEEEPELQILTEAEKLMVIGVPVPRILEVVDILKPLQVVIGGQGRSQLEQLFIGSKAAQLVKLCPVPTTIVKIAK